MWLLCDCRLGDEGAMIAGLAKITFQMKEEQDFKAPVVSDDIIKGKSTSEMT